MSEHRTATEIENDREWWLEEATDQYISKGVPEVDAADHARRIWNAEVTERGSELAVLENVMPGERADEDMEDW